MNFGFVECDFCDQRYASQKGLDRHKCERRNRWESLTKGQGRAALNAYKEWMRVRGYQEPTAETFIDSKHYNSFMNFIAFTNKMMVPDRPGYIKYLSDMKLLPSFWTRDDVYRLYISEFDKLYSPLKQVEISVKTMTELSRALDCELPEVWDDMLFNELLRLLEAKKLSPWFLLNCTTFHLFLRKCNPRERLVFDTVVSKESWFKVFREKPKTVAKILSTVKHLKV